MDDAADPRIPERVHRPAPEPLTGGRLRRSKSLLLAAPQTPSIWYDPDIEDSELVLLDDADRAAWHAECEQSRVNAVG